MLAHLTFWLIATLIPIWTTPAAASEALGSGWSKAVVWPAVPGESVRSEELAIIGAERVRDYESFALVRVPTSLAQQAEGAAASLGLRLQLERDWDRLLMPGMVLDTKAATPSGLGSIRKYPDDEGLYVVQFDGPLTEEMVQQIPDSGLLHVAYVPYNGALVCGKATDVAALAATKKLQWASIYQPEFRAQPTKLAPAEEIQDLLVQLVDTPKNEATWAFLRASSTITEKASTYLKYQVVRVSATSAIIPELLRDPYVVGVEYAGLLMPSGEREAIAATTLRSSPPPTPEPYQNGQQPIKVALPSPTPAPDYRTWLSNRGVIDTSNYRIAFVDSGLPQSHPDITNGRSITYLNYTTEPNGYDNVGHGTAVASLALGDSVAGSVEPTPPPPTPPAPPFFWGMGLAPKTKALSQKVVDTNTGQRYDQTLTLTRDAKIRGCTVQNHSMNYYTLYGNCALSGMYTIKAQEADVAVRDGDPYAAGDQPMPITVSAGNTGGLSIDACEKVAPIATAKNVLAVGASESFRGFLGPCGQHRFQSEDMTAEYLSNVSSISSRGTVDGRIKPDIVAPATLVSFARKDTQTFWCFNPTDSYSIDSGTSFAAPQAAAAYVLVSKKRNAVLSPAMLKAAIIGNSLSLKGGVDRFPFSSGVVAPRPNAVQGFGRLYLGDALGSGVTQTYLDESSWAPFTGAGQTRSRTFIVTDQSKPTVIVAAWTDEPGQTSCDPCLVRDIDMWISFFPYYYTGNQIDQTKLVEESLQQSPPVIYDRRNNVEMIIVPPGALTTFVLRLTTYTWGGILPNQRFAVFASNAQ